MIINSLVSFRFIEPCFWDLKNFPRNTRISRTLVYIFSADLLMTLMKRYTYLYAYTIERS